mmetsp:Transcript_43174/g.137298  ORF Transcript_43174/g.137298 Transcript_43174/m.137298 type:complete len:334 (-) Transcript_43174:92-1093(-)
MGNSFSGSVTRRPPSNATGCTLCAAEGWITACTSADCPTVPWPAAGAAGAAGCGRSPTGGKGPAVGRRRAVRSFNSRPPAAAACVACLTCRSAVAPGTGTACRTAPWAAGGAPLLLAAWCTSACELPRPAAATVVFGVGVACLSITCTAGVALPPAAAMAFDAGAVCLSAAWRAEVALPPAAAMAAALGAGSLCTAPVLPRPVGVEIAALWWLAAAALERGAVAFNFTIVLGFFSPVACFGSVVATTFEWRGTVLALCSGSDFLCTFLATTNAVWVDTAAFKFAVALDAICLRATDTASGPGCWCCVLAPAATRTAAAFVPLEGTASAATPMA